MVRDSTKKDETGIFLRLSIFTHGKDKKMNVPKVKNKIYFLKFLAYYIYNFT